MFMNLTCNGCRLETVLSSVKNTVVGKHTFLYIGRMDCRIHSTCVNTFRNFVDVTLYVSVQCYGSQQMVKLS